MVFLHKLSFFYLLQDRYADSESLPTKDEEQNYFLTGFEESNEKTVLKFTRKFDTCDTRDRKIKVLRVFSFLFRSVRIF